MSIPYYGYGDLDDKSVAMLWGDVEGSGRKSIHARSLVARLLNGDFGVYGRYERWTAQKLAHMAFCESEMEKELLEEVDKYDRHIKHRLIELDAERKHND